MNSCKRVHPSDAEGIVDRSNSKTSILSQSPSELNVAIMDMLNVRQTPTKCDILCRGMYEIKTF